MSKEKPVEKAPPEAEFKFKEYRGGIVTEADSWGMGYPEAKDRLPGPTQKEVDERKAKDPDYTPNHDGRIYMIV